MTLSRRHRAELKRRRGFSEPEPTSDPWQTPRQKVDAEGACRACHATGELDPAHTIPRSLGGGQTADSVIPLCPGCHRDQHAGRIELLPLLTRAEQALERADALARLVAEEWLLPSNSSERLREAAQSYLATRHPAQEDNAAISAPSEEDGE